MGRPFGQFEFNLQGPVNRRAETKHGDGRFGKLERFNNSADNQQYIVYNIQVSLYYTRYIWVSDKIRYD